MKKINEITTKQCSRCKKTKNVSEFSYRKDTGKYRSECKECRRLEYKENKNVREQALNRAKEYYQNKKEEVLTKKRKFYRENVKKKMLSSAKTRAKKKNVPFDLTEEDIFVPEFCPVLGIPLKVSDKCSTSNSPSLDRIIPEKGYVKNNIVVISHKANTIKNDATIDELKKIVNFYEKLLSNIGDREC